MKLKILILIAISSCIGLTIYLIIGYTGKTNQAIQELKVATDSMTLNQICDCDYKSRESLYDKIDFMKRSGDVKDYKLSEGNLHIVSNDSDYSYDISLNEENKPIWRKSSSTCINTIFKDYFVTYLSLKISLAVNNSDTYAMLSDKIDKIVEEAKRQKVKVAYKYVDIDKTRELEYSINEELERTYLNSEIRE